MTSHTPSAFESSIHVKNEECVNMKFCPVQHPVLDEPIAEAVCIIADTEKWTVQVASSQRRATEANKLGKEVLVSSLVSNLLQSTHQLYKLNLSPNFVCFSSKYL